MRSRTCLASSTLPSSKRNAQDDVVLLGVDRLFQNSVAWLKWSRKLSLRSRILLAVDPLGDSYEAAGVGAGLERAAAAERVGLVADAAGVDGAGACGRRAGGCGPARPGG